MRHKIILAIIITGFAGSVGQLLFIRELLIVFHGNELSIGIVLANWLLLEGIGALSAGRVSKNLLPVFIILQILFSLYLPFGIYFTRTLKLIIGLTAGEALGLFPMFYSSLLLLLPASLFHGALFPTACRLYNGDSRTPKTGQAGRLSSRSETGQAGRLSSRSVMDKAIEQAGRLSSRSETGQAGRLSSLSEIDKAVGFSYVYETLGSIIGSLIFTFILIRCFNSFDIVFEVMLLNFLACIILLTKPVKLFTKTLLVVSIVLSLTSVYFLLSHRASAIHQSSVSRQFPGVPVYYQNSIYGNIAVTRNEEQYTFFKDGVPSISIPAPDLMFVEDFVHFPLLMHPAPESILIIGGGSGGVISEILKHPVSKIDYLELDPLLLKAINEFRTKLTFAELNSTRVNVKYLDGRLFLRTNPSKYDVIFLGLSEATSLQVNRFFTKEFFELARTRLADKGILVFTLPGSLSYISDELGNLNSCILTALRSVYPYVRVIPGDLNMFLCSSVKINDDPELITQRLGDRRVKSRMITYKYIKYRLNPGKEKWFLSSIINTPAVIMNEDFSPSGVFYNLSYWNALFAPRIRDVFNSYSKLGIGFFIKLFCILLLCCIVLRIKFRRIAFPACIASTGFAGMIFSLVLIFAFQSVYGYVFRQIGILTAAFMAGGTLGALVITLLMSRFKRGYRILILIEACMIIFSVALAEILYNINALSNASGVFILLCCIAGFLVGIEFPLVNRIYASSGSTDSQVGLLYWADLFGGWFAGIFAGVIMLPVMGLLETCMVVAILKISSLVLVASSRN